MKYFLTVIVFAIITPNVLTYIYYECCPQIEDEGFYCTNDLSGYLDCVYEEDTWCLGKRAETKCPNGTRCSCYIDHWCSVKGRDDICASYETPAPYQETFSLKYHHYQHHKSLNEEFHQSYETNKYGEIIRNDAQKRYFWKEGIISELIFQNEDGTFTKYRWWDTTASKCERSTTDNLPYFSGSDINKYTRISSTKAGNKELQMWYFQIGRNSWALEFFKKWWTVTYDPVTNRILPVKYYEEFIGDEMADYTIYTNTTWSINHSKSAEMMAETPPFCA